MAGAPSFPRVGHSRVCMHSHAGIERIESHNVHSTGEAPVATGLMQWIAAGDEYRQ